MRLQCHQHFAMPQNDPPASPNTMRLLLVMLHSRQMFFFLSVSLLVAFSDFLSVSLSSCGMFLLDSFCNLFFCDYFFLFLLEFSFFVPLSFCEFSCITFFCYFYFCLFSCPTVMFFKSPYLGSFSTKLPLKCCVCIWHFCC